MDNIQQALISLAQHFHPSPPAFSFSDSENPAAHPLPFTCAPFAAPAECRPSFYDYIIFRHAFATPSETIRFPFFYDAYSSAFDDTTQPDAFRELRLPFRFPDSVCLVIPFHFFLRHCRPPPMQRPPATFR